MSSFPKAFNTTRTLKSKKEAYFEEATENIVTCLHAICLMSPDEAKCDSYGGQKNK